MVLASMTILYFQKKNSTKQNFHDKRVYIKISNKTKALSSEGLTKHNIYVNSLPIIFFRLNSKLFIQHENKMKNRYCTTSRCDLMMLSITKKYEHIFLLTTHLRVAITFDWCCHLSQLEQFTIYCPITQKKESWLLI